MCETSARAMSTSPRWRVLYGLTLVPFAAIAAVEAIPMPAAVRETVRCLLALVAFAGMAFWVRGNRAALDLAQGCDCAAPDLTIRELAGDHAGAPVGLPEPSAIVRANDEALLPR
jgi:hypothetical protein